MSFRAILAALLVACLPLVATEHSGKEYIQENGYEGPATCEVCHPGKASEFLKTVHWKHASRVSRVENLEPRLEYGMKNRIYTMCNGNDIVNKLKEIPASPSTGKRKYTGCDTCHPGDHLHEMDSRGPEAEAAIDCLVCHSSAYDASLRKPYRNPQGQVAMGQDRSLKAALAVGRPSVKNCMTCHESAGGGTLVKRGFAYDRQHDVHAAKGLVCVDCHKGKEHRVPTGTDPNNWASDGLSVTCDSCHTLKPHKDADLDRHTARVACQTCHIPKTGGAFAKDFTHWEQQSDKFFEPTTLRREANETTPVYAWFNGSVANRPDFIGPKGSRKDPKSRITPFKIFQGKAYFDRKTGRLLSMDFAPPMSNGDTLAGVASAAKTLGIKSYDPVPGWQTIYFGSNHLVAPKAKALSCENCHAPNGVLNWQALGYSGTQLRRLTTPELYFKRAAEKAKEEW
nr:hypothetical protein [uncultured Holophaga sp.]